MKIMAQRSSKNRITLLWATTATTAQTAGTGDKSPKNTLLEKCSYGGGLSPMQLYSDQA